MKFKIMGKKGDAEFDYDDVELAKTKFNELTESNYLPVAIEPNGKRLLTEFNPKVNEIVWMNKIVGG